RHRARHAALARRRLSPGDRPRRRCWRVARRHPQGGARRHFAHGLDRRSAAGRAGLRRCRRAHPARQRRARGREVPCVSVQRRSEGGTQAVTSTHTDGATATPSAPPRRLRFTHDRWMDALGLPIYSGYYIEDMRGLQLGRWEERGCDAAFIQLEGQQGITETRVSEIPPRAVLPPVRLMFDEVVYVVQGRGATTVWRSGSERKSFEWTENSMFLLPRHHFHQFNNTHGSRPARLLHYNYFPLLLSASPDPEAFISTNRGEAAEPLRQVDLQAMYAEPALKTTSSEEVTWKRGHSVWLGSFFPDMSAWDKLTV